MRGKVCYLDLTVSPHGITPAYAGKRRFDVSKRRHVKDHPRVCGEKSFHIVFNFSTLGSPPRMRGKVGYILASISIRGITPAYAGKRNRRFPDLLSIWDHPRVCGEKYTKPGSMARKRGSPPRMRGKDDPAHPVATPARITPAYAGKREKQQLKYRVKRDHPRVCGEKH